MSDEPRLEIALTETAIDPGSLIARSYRPDCGAVLMFLGTTRQWTGSEQTSFLEYDAYREMATAELERLANEAFEKWDLRRLAIVHRLGVVAVGEASIAVVVSSPHRLAAFEAGPWLMDRIKADVPIWKKDHTPEGQAEWLHPVTESQTEKHAPSRPGPLSPKRGEGEHDALSSDESAGTQFRLPSHEPEALADLFKENRLAPQAHGSVLRCDLE